MIKQKIMMWQKLYPELKNEEGSKRKCQTKNLYFVSLYFL